MSIDTQDWIDSLDIPDLRPEITEELHHAWRVARDEALLAYREWCHAGADEEDAAYCAYVAAVDREEAAALHLQRNVQANPVIGMSFPPAPA
jgi:hypothetical protein